MFLFAASAALLVGSNEIISALFGYGSFSEKAVLNLQEHYIILA